VNYSAWPHHRFIKEDQRAQVVGICRFVDIGPSGVPEAQLASLEQAWKPPREKNWSLDPQTRRFNADALSAMRLRSAQEASLRIVWGGTISGAAGWMAGILEEIAFSLALQKPVLVWGGFGGCAGLLADFLSDEHADWPDPLTPAACADPERDGLLTEQERDKLRERFHQAKTRLTEFRTQLHSQKVVNGIESELVRGALREETARHLIGAASQAVRQCSGEAGGVGP
jgi:hypothetical protein